MTIRDYITNINDIYYRYGKFWSWLYKNVNRKNIKTSATVDSINNAEAFDSI